PWRRELPPPHAEPAGRELALARPLVPRRRDDLPPLRPPPQPAPASRRGGDAGGRADVEGESTRRRTTMRLRPGALAAALTLLLLSAALPKASAAERAA